LTLGKEARAGFDYTRSFGVGQNGKEERQKKHSELLEET